jgi:pimeloyl-ACP methyl ester carboxylesterase
MVPVPELSDREAGQVERANASGRAPVLFIHGLWLLPSSWDPWAGFFEDTGYAALTPDWPDDPETVEEARANPDVLAGKTLGQIADHTAEVIAALDRKPVVIGHSTGGLLAFMIAGRGIARSPSPSASSGTAGRTPSTKRRPRPSTTSSTSRPPGSR